MKRTNTITAVLFLAVLAGMLALTCLGLPEVKAQLAAGWAGQAEDADRSLPAKAGYVAGHMETALNDALDRSHLFIQLYGGIQRLTGRRTVADVSSDTTVTKLRDGALTFCGLDNQYTVPTEQAENTAAFAEALAARDIPFLAVAAPQKLRTDEDLLPSGLKEYGNETADTYLAAVDAAGVDTLDLRPAFADSGHWNELFFRTDHHWKPEGAFFAYQTLADELDRRYGFATDETYTDLNSYDLTVYEGWFLGSQGKRVGSLYAGTDDFTVFSPKFDTNFTYSIPSQDTVRTGDFNEALCFGERLAEKDWFGGNPYTYYSGGDYGISVMTNENNPDGPRIILIRDSFSCALAPFLALSCGELITVDLRYYDGDLLAELSDLQPDLVVLLYTAGSFRLSTLFQFAA